MSEFLRQTSSQHSDVIPEIPTFSLFCSNQFSYTNFCSNFISDTPSMALNLCCKLTIAETLETCPGYQSEPLRTFSGSTHGEGLLSSRACPRHFQNEAWDSTVCYSLIAMHSPTFLILILANSSIYMYIYVTYFGTICIYFIPSQSALKRLSG